jgi:hypothetical protein
MEIGGSQLNNTAVKVRLTTSLEPGKDIAENPAHSDTTATGEPA